jgi:hypothetical protein
MSQPHFWKSVRMTLTLPKWGLGSPSRLPKLQSSIAGVKTPHLEAFLISLKIYRSVDVENGLAWAIWTSVAQVMAKRRPGVKLTIWLPTTKSRESSRLWCVQVECSTPLESSQGELQVCCRPHPNRRSEQKVMNLQSPKSPNWDSFGTPPWESRDKKPFGCRCHREM